MSYHGLAVELRCVCHYGSEVTVRHVLKKELFEVPHRGMWLLQTFRSALTRRVIQDIEVSILFPLKLRAKFSGMTAVGRIYALSFPEATVTLAIANARLASVLPGLTAIRLAVWSHSQVEPLTLRNQLIITTTQAVMEEALLFSFCLLTFFMRLIIASWDQ